MMKKESFRRILIRIFWISLVFTIGFSWVYIRYAVPDRLNLVVNEEEVFHFALPPGVTFESDSEEVVLKNASEIPQGMIGSNARMQSLCMGKMREATGSK